MSLYGFPISLWAGIYSGLRTGTQEVTLSFSRLSLGGIPEGYSVAPWVTSEEEQKSGKGLNGEQLDINLGCHQVGSSLSHLADRMEEASAETPVSVRGRLTPAREGHFGGRPISIPIYSKEGHLG